MCFAGGLDYQENSLWEKRHGDWCLVGGGGSGVGIVTKRKML